MTLNSVDIQGALKREEKKDCSLLASVLVFLSFLEKLFFLFINNKNNLYCFYFSFG